MVEMNRQDFQINAEAIKKMNDVPQKHVVDLAQDKGVVIPNSFLDPNIIQFLEQAGYELPGEKTYERYVAALNNRYPNRYIVPFAKSIANDDIVGFVVNDPKSTGPIVEIHDFASDGYEDPRYFSDFTSWLMK